MKKRKNIYFAFSLLLTSVLACNLPSAAPQENAPELQTAAAQTVAAALTPQTSTTVPQSIIIATPSLTLTGTNTPNVTATITSTITPTYSVPMLIVRKQTNCRTGPGQDYEVVFTYLSGKELEIVGRYDPDNYWLVKSAESPTGVCWLWGEFVTVSGSYWIVSSVTPPPTATMPPPVAPSLRWNYECTYNGINDDLVVDLKWADHANNETGYRVFRNGELIADLPAGSTLYTDRVAVDSGKETSYRVDAYNSTGAASDSTIPIVCG